MSKDNNQVERKNSKAHLAICPLDGRYANIGQKLSPYFSEFALVKNRVKVEVMWLKRLMQTTSLGIPQKFQLGHSEISRITDIYDDFNEESFGQVKKIEGKINHDVKAVELYVAEKLKEAGLEKIVSYVHIGCTSEDITNIAYAIMISGALENVWKPAAKKLIDKIASIGYENAEVPMLAHTHGQPATPTTVGKELAVYVQRLRNSFKNVECIPIVAKFNGATGNYSAISTAFSNSFSNSDGDLRHLCKLFVIRDIGISFNPVTTQIESHDYMCHLFDAIRHFNNVLLDFDLDMWLYISMGYFKQLLVKEEVGSSTMPHKVNPIRFENSESNIDTSNALLMALSNKLPHSRMQRDLSDSSSQRNIGMAIGYSLQAIEQTTAGLSKVALNYDKIESDLNDNWEVLAEPIQTMLRKYGVPDAYDSLKELTRGRKVTKKDIQEFIKSLDMLSDIDRNTLLKLTPSNYTGYAAKIAGEVCIDRFYKY